MQTRSSQTQLVNLRTLASNFTFLTTGEILSRLCTFAAFTFLARVLGPETFGHLEFTLAVMVLFTLLVDLGTSPYGAREIAKSQNRAEEIIGIIFSLRITLAAVGYLLLSFFAFILIDADSPVRSLLLLYGITLFAIPGFFQWVFQGLDKMKLVALGSLIRQLIFMTGVLVLVRSTSQLNRVAFVEWSAVAAYVVYCLTTNRFHINLTYSRFNIRAIYSVFLQSLPIGLSELTWALTWYSPIILLGLLVGGESVGLFSAAHRPVMTIHVFIWIYFYNIFPSMSRLAGNSSASLQDLMTSSLKITAWAAIFIGMIGTILARPLILLVFGQQYAATVSTFSILVWILPIALMSGNYRYALIAANHQRYEFFSSLLSALTALILGLILIPLSSAHGAAAALLLSAVINWIFVYMFVRNKISRIPFLPHILKPLAAGLLMVTGYQLLQSLNIWLAVSVSVGVYLSSLIGLQPELKRLIM
ncbi:MAG: flippase [Planctomycetota bacterium]|jgi:O-antigen/teichoic acid export membrane protein